MTFRYGRASKTTAIAVLMVLSGCIAETQPSQFYVLSATEPATARSPKGPALSVGPVTLPRYLDRPQIVTRPNPNELSVAEYDRWGGQLEGNVAQVLAENLSRRLRTSRVTLFPGEGAGRADLRVSVSLSRFECTGTGGKCALEARWQIQRPAPAGGDPVIGASSLTTSAPGAGYAGIAAAMSQLLGDLAREIAVAMPSSARVRTES